MNPVKGQVPLKLADGREFTLVLDMEALIEAEAIYGKPLQGLMVDLATGFAGAARAMLYGAMRACHPNVTLREATELFARESDAITDALERATLASFPEANDSAEGKKGENPPGRRSGRSGAKQG